LDATQRFSSRVENYVSYRPSYPPAVIELLGEVCYLTPATAIADIGSGTGLLTELFLQHGNPVFGVEPNQPMREAGAALLAHYPNFRSIAGRAEATTLPPHAVDFVTAGQAFHWFDVDRARAEFNRILKPHGWVVLVWNERCTDNSPFARAYEQLLLDYATDYQLVNAKRVDATLLDPFFGRQGYTLATFENSQQFDLAGLQGRLLSSSYIPEEGHPSYKPMLAELERIFRQFAADGTVRIDYQTLVYFGH
jgi:SAM-dependent methyltransferase